MIADTLHTVGSTRSRVAQIVLLAGLLTLLVPLGATAAPPEDTFEVIDVDATFVNELFTAQCDFEVLHTLEGTVKLSGSRDETGELITDMARLRLTHTLLGPNGASLTFPEVGVDKFTDNPDGTVTFVTSGQIGLRIVVPGEGLVVAYVGRAIRVFTIDPATGATIGAETIFEAGQQPWDVDFEEQMTAICTALAG